MGSFFYLVRVGLTVACIFIFHARDVQANYKTASHQVTQKYNLSVCAFFKNESLYLKEWIEYHKLIGIEHFYLYDNKSQDHSSGVLSRYIKEGIVTRIYWPDRIIVYNEQDIENWVLSTKLPAYEHAAKYLALGETEWLVFLDVDEYLVPIEGNTMHEVLQKYDDCPAITIQCDVFDASVIDVLPRRELLIETLELISPPQQNLQKSVEKMIFRPDRYTSFTWPPYKCRFQEDALPKHLAKNQVRINKYVNRANGFLYSGKRKNPLRIDNRLLTEQQLDELLRTGFEIEDKERAILRFEPELRKKMGLDTGLRWRLE